MVHCTLERRILSWPLKQMSKNWTASSELVIAALFLDTCMTWEAKRGDECQGWNLDGAVPARPRQIP